MITTNPTTVEQNVIKVNPEGTEQIIPEAPSMYPASAERECKRVVKRYYRILDLLMKKHLDPLVKEYKNQIHTDAVSDSVYKIFRTKARRSLNAMNEELIEALKYFGLDEQLEKVSKITQTHSIREWRKAVKDALGIDVSEKYYKGGIFDKIRKKWLSDSVTNIKKMMSDSVQHVIEMMQNPENVDVDFIELIRQIQDEYESSKTFAFEAAGDQVSMLNAELTKSIHEDAGVTHYVWISQHDDKVRTSHRAFDGKIFSWKCPPDGWYLTKSKGLILTGRRCHPGEDYGCRCHAKPVFGVDVYKIPVNESVDYEKQRKAQGLH